jgi:hypothetical protein
MIIQLPVCKFDIHFDPLPFQLQLQKDSSL